MDTDSATDLQDHAARAAATEAADARATRNLIRIGIWALIVLAIWIGIVLYGMLG